MSQDKQAAYKEARRLQLESLTQMLLSHELVDGILIVRLTRDPEKDGRTYFDFFQNGIESGQMIGIINKLMTDVNQVFAHAQLDPPFPNAKEFVKSFPPTSEG